MNFLKKKQREAKVVSDQREPELYGSSHYHDCTKCSFCDFAFLKGQKKQSWEFYPNSFNEESSRLLFLETAPRNFSSGQFESPALKWIKELILDSFSNSFDICFGSILPVSYLESAPHKNEASVCFDNNTKSLIENFNPDLIIVFGRFPTTILGSFKSTAEGLHYSIFYSLLESPFLTLSLPHPQQYFYISDETLSSFRQALGSYLLSLIQFFFPKER